MALRIFCSLCGGLRAFFLAPLGIGRANLLKYGKWAVVTGASEGIGRGYALELARRGLNVVLMSRSRDKLEKVAEEVKEKYGRQTRVIPVDFSDSGLDIYDKIAKEIRDLDVGVLVNNVGMFCEHLDEFTTIKAEGLYDSTHINCHPVVQMCHIVVPMMVKRGGGYVVNVSSANSYMPFPRFFVYSATKVFVNYISDGLRKEYARKGISVQTVTPWFVLTAMLKNMNMKTNFFVRDPISYTKVAVATIGILDTTYGCFPHALQGFIVTSTPTFVRDWLIRKAAVIDSKRRLQAEKLNKND